MKVSVISKFVAFAAVFSLSAVVFSGGGTVSAHDTDEPHEHEAGQTAEENTYTYTAQAGDSYSLIARKAVQTYGAVHEVSLSQAQIVAAETKLTLAAHSPVLNQGQKVEIKESDIKREVEAAQALSEAHQAAWNRYAIHANFNTDHVGQARQ